ncbi:MAG: hypothetical protein HEQ32_01200 [Vampirovibrio sp.]
MKPHTFSSPLLFTPTPHSTKIGKNEYQRLGTTYVTEETFIQLAESALSLRQERDQILNQFILETFGRIEQSQGLVNQFKLWTFQNESIEYQQADQAFQKKWLEVFKARIKLQIETSQEASRLFNDLALS